MGLCLQTREKRIKLAVSLVNAPLHAAPDHPIPVRYRLKYRLVNQPGPPVSEVLKPGGAQYHVAGFRQSVELERPYYSFRLENLMIDPMKSIDVPISFVKKAIGAAVSR